MALQPEDDTFVWPPMHWGPIGMPAPQQIVEDSPYAEEVAPPEVVAAPVDPTLGPHVIPGIGIPMPVAEEAIATLPPPDAVTGVDAAPINVPPPVEETAALEQVGPRPDSPDFDPLAPQSWDNTIGQEDLHQMALRHPQEFAAYSQAHDAARASEQRQQEAVVARKNAEQEEQNYADLRASQAKADQVRDEVANTRIDANRWRESRSVPQSIAAFLSVVVGGLYQARKGGPNIGLEIINKAIDQDIAEQESNLANKRGVLAEMREAGMSRFQSQQAYRTAVYARAKEDLLTKLQDFDPRGTTALEGAKHAYQFDMQIAQAAELARQQALKEGLTAAKERREMLKSMDEHGEAQDKHALAQRKLAGGGTGAKQSPEYFVSRGLMPPPVPMTDKEYKAWLGNRKAGAEVTKADQEALAGQSQGMSKEEAERGIAGLKQKDDKPFIAQGTPEKVAGVRDRVAATKTVVRILDQIGRTRTGWSPDVTKSTEWKQLKADWAAAKGVAKDVLGLGALSGPDEALIENYLGGLDPTGIRDPGPGLKRARQNMVNMTGDVLTGVGYDGKFDIPEPKLNAVEETPSDARFKKALKAPTLTDVIEASGGAAADTKSAADRYSPYVTPGSAPTIDNVVLPEVRREIEALETAAKRGDEEAINKLGQMSEGGGNIGTQKAAAAALFAAGRATETYEEAAGKDQATARDPMPQRPFIPAPAPTANKPKRKPR